MILLIWWSTLYIIISKFSFFKFLVPRFSKVNAYDYFHLKFYVLRERSRDIGSFVEHPLHRICYFGLPLFTHNASSEVIFSLNVRCSAKETVILLLTWDPLFIVISKCIAS